MNERILLVDNNKALSKLVKKKIEENLDFDIIQSYTLKETKEILEDNDDFFIALLDTNLPDASDEEVIDVLQSYNIPSIILTGSIDESPKDEIFNKKGVVDYVYKGNIESAIKNVSKNRDIKLIVVNSSQTARMRIKKVLQRYMFKVLVAAHGEEALNYIEDNKDVKLVLTDFNMPVIDGLELTREIREKYDKHQIAIIFLIGDDEHFISTKFLKLGANDFLKKPFSDQELIWRVNNILKTQEQTELLSKFANYDFLTGVYNRRYFFNRIKDFLYKNQKFAIAMLDIDHFKNINYTYGYCVGDKILRNLAIILKNNTKSSDIVAKCDGDGFCIALANVDEKSAISFFVKLKNIISKEKIKIKDTFINYSISIGVYIDENKNIDITSAIINADKALFRAKNGGRNRIEIY